MPPVDEDVPSPPAALRTRVVTAAALGVLLVVGAALLAGPWLEAGAMYPWKAATTFAVTMAIATAFLGEHPFPRFGAANHVTTIRLMLLALMAGLIGVPPSSRVAGAAVVLTALIAALDGMDGWLARRQGTASDFGARFDMETDALLILVLSVLVWQHEKAGPWVVAGGLMRYGFIAARWRLPWMAGPLTPTFRAKAVAIGHMLALGIALAPVVPAPLSGIAAGVSLMALSWSFAVDVGRLRRQRA